MELPVYHSGSLTFTAAFAEPAFDLAYAGPRLQRSVYRALQAFDVDQAGIQESNAHTGPSGWHLSVNFLSFAAALKLRVNGLEVIFLSERAREITLCKRVLAAIESAVFEADNYASPVVRIFLQQTHCKLKDKTLRERLPSIGTFSDSLGTFAGQGIALYFTNPLFSNQANLIFDKSSVLDEGLFVQVRCEFDANKFDLMTGIDNFQNYLATVERAFNLPEILGGMA